VERARIRPYEPGDRARVREIAFRTGYMGDPVDWLWGDPESFADLFTGYYTDEEPGSFSVVELDGRVAGYLAGCVDSSRARGASAAHGRRLLRRGGLLRPGIAPFLWRSILDVARERRVPDESILDPRWPAHLHIDLLPEARGRGLGRRLMEGWLARLRELRVPGVHLGTFRENAPAIAFFEACGFSRLGDPARVPGFRTRDGQRMHVQWMTRSLAGGAGEGGTLE